MEEPDDLKEIDVVGLVVDAIATPVSPVGYLPAENFASEDMLIPFGEDEDGETIYVPNLVQQIDSFRTLEVALRSRRSEPISVSAIVHGLSGDNGSRILVGTAPQRLEPGATTKITVTTEHGIYKCQLTLMTCSCS